MLFFEERPVPQGWAHVPLIAGHEGHDRMLPGYDA